MASKRPDNAIIKILVLVVLIVVPLNVQNIVNMSMLALVLFKPVYSSTYQMWRVACLYRETV